MKLTIFSVLFLFIGRLAAAQFNDSTHYYLNYTGAGTINKTQDGRSYILNNTLKFSLLKKKLELNAVQGWIYGENAASKTNSDYSSVVDISFLKGRKKIYYWALANYEKSFSLKIDDRLQAGGGIGYYVADNKNLLLVISDGPLYETSNLREPDKYGRKQYETLRNSLRIKFRLVIKELIILDGTDFLQNSLADKNDYIIRSNTNLSVKINQWLNFTTSLTYNRLNLTGTENLLINYGLSFQKYF